MIQKIWKQISPFFHVIAFFASIVFTAGIVSANVTGYDDRITALEKDNQQLKIVMARIDQRLTDIAEYLHVPHKGGESYER